MTFQQIILWLVAAFAGLFALFLSTVAPIGWYLTNRRYINRREKRSCSWTWPVGGIAGGLAILAAPVFVFPERLAWCWLPLAVESLLYILGFAGLRSIAYHVYRMDNHARGDDHDRSG